MKRVKFRGQFVENYLKIICNRTGKLVRIKQIITAKRLKLNKSKRIVYGIHILPEYLPQDIVITLHKKLTVGIQVIVNDVFLSPFGED